MNMNAKKRVNGAWVDAPYYVHKTATDISTTLPVNIIATGAEASVGLKGNTEQQTYSGKNLISYPYYSSDRTINGVTFSTERNGRIMANGVATGSVLFYLMRDQNLKAGTYTLSVTRNAPILNINLQVFDSSKGITTDGLITTIGSSTSEFIERTFTLNEDTNVHLLYAKSGLTETYIDEYVQLELGSTATSYEPYVGGVPSPNPNYPQEVRGCGDKTTNLFNGTIEQGSLADVNGALLESPARVRTTKINVSEGTAYTISSNLIVRGIIAYKNNTFVVQVYRGSTTPKTSTSFTVPSGANQIAIAFMGNPTGSIDITPNDLEWLMLNTGETALPYEPYGYKIPFATTAEDGSESITTTVYLDKPLYKIGDYADTLCYAEQKVDRVIGELVLTGEEAFVKNDTGNPNNYLYYKTGYRANEYCYCTHLANMGTLFASKVGVFNSNYVLFFNFGSAIMNAQPSGNTVAGLKEYLSAQYAAGTPVRVYYVLATPESKAVEPVEIPTLSGTTVIDVTTSVKPSEISLDYTGWHPAVVHERVDGAWVDKS